MKQLLTSLVSTLIFVCGSSFVYAQDIEKSSFMESINIDDTYLQTWNDALQAIRILPETGRNISRAEADNILRDRVACFNNASSVEELARCQTELFNAGFLYEGLQETLKMLEETFITIYSDPDDGYDFPQQSMQSQSDKYQPCYESDSYQVPAALALDVFDNPVNEQAFINYIINNGVLASSDEGVSLYYLILRAETTEGLNRKYCDLYQSSDSDKPKKVMWYNLYFVFENWSGPL